ncbi:STAS domain-containing protein [Streptomyces sp. NPDC051582]|uniref:STAS domain-containing protein n=1 Tax=Streptomyces sp. NPDC051582 TaxID=3155167 RepID=UPI003428CF9B
MSPLRTTVLDAATGPLLQVAGNLDYTTAPRLHELLTTLTLHPDERLIIDLAHLDFCDSSGISALIAARNHALAHRAGIALAAVPARTLRVLRLVGLDQVFAIHPDAETAMRT